MSNQNRFLLPHQPSSSANARATSAAKVDASSDALLAQALGQENEYQVDTDFDSYWEEEARNPHRNRIRIGRQYQATVPPLLKQGERDSRKLDHLETLSFCPKRSAKVTNAELDHYFTVAKSLNLFASLVETRSLLGRDVTIADLNRIRHKEGLSLASVIQPPSRQHPASSANVLSQSSQQTQQQQINTANISQRSPVSQSEGSTSMQTANLESRSEPTATTSVSTPTTTETQIVPSAVQEIEAPLNQPLMKALSHFISLHHPCHHDHDCKKLLKDIPLEDDSVPAVNLRTTSASSSSSLKRSRSKQQTVKPEETESRNQVTIGDQEQSVTNDVASSSSSQSKGQAGGSYEDWTREEVSLFSKAIEVCGKNFGSIKKEFLPSKSVRSIVEYYYIGSRDVSDGKKKSNQTVDTNEVCSSPEKTQANNNGQGGGGSASGGDSLPNQPQLSNPNGDGNGGSSNSTNKVSNNATDLSDACDTSNKQQASIQIQGALMIKNNTSTRQNKSIPGTKSKQISKNIDARMSVYNFDDEMKEDSDNISPPIRFDCSRPGAEVKPLKAKPILPNASTDVEAGNSNVGSLKFFMDGQLVLKLNACQEQQEGGDKCHWVQSGDKLPAPSRQKRYSKRANSDQQRQSSDLSQNGSQSNSVVSSQHDEDSTKTHEDLTDGEDSKESANSFTNQPQHHVATTPRQKSFSASPTPKRIRQANKTESTASNCASPHQGNQPILPIDYNRLAVNNRMKESVASLGNINTQPQLVNQAAAAAAAMPWLQANSLAMAAALLGGIPFAGSASGLVNPQLQNSHMLPIGTNLNSNIGNNNNINMINNNIVNLVTSKPMDLSVEHHQSPPKPIQTTAKSSRSRSKQKNS